MKTRGVLYGMSREAAGGARRVSAAWIALVLVATAGARGQKPVVKAYADPPEVAVGERFRLVVEVVGAEEVENVTAPERFGFVQGADPPEPAVTVRVAGEGAGESGNSFTLTYVLVAREPGFFEMGPFRITADGRNLESEPVAVLVGRQSFSDVVVKTRVDPSVIHMGDDFTLAAEIFGSRSWTHEFILPDVFDLSRKIYRTGVLTETSASWRLEADEAGEFVIPPVRVVAGEQTYESEPLTLVIRPPRVEVETELEARSIWVGGEFDFEVRVGGVSELDEEPTVTGADAFTELLDVEKWSRDDGEGLVLRDYRFRALRAGTFEIGPVRIVADGRAYESRRISLVVDEVPTGDEEPRGAPLLQVLPGKTRAYVNEPVVVTYAVAWEESDTHWTFGTESWPSFENFDVMEMSYAGFDHEAVVDGRRYERSLVGKFVLRPRRAGRLDLRAPTLEARSWEFMVGGREETSVILTSDPPQLEVLRLPDEGRPGPFRGHVGTLEAVSWVDRTRAEVGETIALRVEVAVEGVVEDLPDPEIDFPRGLAMVRPESPTDRTRGRRVRDLRGARTYTYHLTAATPGTYVIPAVEMSYFDPETESYGTTRSHPFTVTVVPAGAEAR